MKPDRRWGQAHIRLKHLYEERCPQGMSQEQFGAEYGIGTQSMVTQYLNGARPLNFEAAAKFAEGLRCTIRDISPEMDTALRERILPALGLKSWRRAAALAFLLVVPQFIFPHNSNAEILHKYAVQSMGCVLCQIVRWMKYSAQIFTFALRTQDSPITAL